MSDRGSTPRLNPFAFPAETTMRFNLLLAAAFSLLISLSSFLLINLFGLGGINNELTMLGALFELIMIGGLCGVVGFSAWGRYRAHAKRLRRTHNMAPLSPDRYAALQRDTASMAETLGIDPPTVEMGTDHKADGQAFGLPGAYSIRVGRRLPLLIKQRPGEGRAVVLHELSHIANGDIGRTYLTEALWRSVVIFGFVPFLLMTVAALGDNLIATASELAAGDSSGLARLLTLSLPTFLLLMAMLAGSLAFVAYLRASIIRIREYYADWRAALYGAEPGLLALLHANPDRARGLRRVFGFHPDPDRRAAMLQNPRDLFRLRLDLPFVVGVLLAVVLVAVMFISFTAVAGLFGPLFSSAGDAVEGLVLSTVLLVIGVILTFGGTYLPVLGIVVYAADALAVQTQRDLVAALALNEKTPPRDLLRLLIAAGLFAFGFQVGINMQPGGILFGSLMSLPGVLGAGTSGVSIGQIAVIVLGLTGWWVGMTLVVFSWFVLVRRLARLLLASRTGAAPPDRRRRWMAAVLAIMLTAILFPAMLVNITIYDTILDYNLPFEVLASLTLPGITVYAVLFVGLWSAGEVLARVVPKRCPSCGERHRGMQAVGIDCGHCGEPLAPWIYAERQLRRAAGHADETIVRMRE